jgi:hypothetical protein
VLVYLSCQSKNLQYGEDRSGEDKQDKENRTDGLVYAPKAKALLATLAAIDRATDQAVEMTPRIALRRSDALAQAAWTCT